MPFSGYRISSNYGYRRHPITGNHQTFHAGIDLVKAHRSPIKAFVPGVVIFAGTGVSGTGFGGYGNVVFIQDRNGYGHLYAHLDRVAVQIRERVEQGQTIGYQGNTGMVTGSHLHYEVRTSVAPLYGWTQDRTRSTVDPTAYLQSLQEVQVVRPARNYLSKGDRGPRVKTMQQGLVELGYNLGGFGPDSIFGNATEAAVRKFQKDHQLVVDGLFGVQSEAKLNELLRTPPKNDTLHLPQTASSWRVYPLNKPPTKGNEIGFLNPKKFGGLQYDILARPQANVVTIQTRDFGRVNIYVGPDTDAVIR